MNKIKKNIFLPQKRANYSGKMLMIMALLFLVFPATEVLPKNQKNSVNTDLSKDVGNLLETLGYQSATNLYVTYVSVGTFADAFGKEVYTAETIVQLTSEYSELIKGNIKQLQLLLDGKIFAKEDKVMLQEIKDIYEILFLQADGLKQLAMTGEKKYLEQYSKARTKAWKKISSLLNIKE